MSQEKYIGMDVHQATISVAVMDASGKLIMECLLETKAATIVEFIQVLGRAGIAFFPTDRGGDITYHGPGQLVGYPIVDLREWKRDVGAYVRAIEQVIIDTLADFAIVGGRIAGLTGVWVG